MCDVDEEAVVTAADAPSIYDIPKVLHREGLDAYVVRRLNLPFRDVDWTLWDDLLQRVHHPNEEVTVGAGRQVHRPARRLPLGRRGAAGRRLRPRGHASTSSGSPPTSAQTPEGAARRLADVDAICVPGGFGIRGIEGKLGALTFARTHKIPTLGLCLGLQCMVIEFARHAGRSREGRVHRVRPRLPRAGDRDDGRAARLRRGRRRPRRHDAARPLPGRAQGGLGRPGDVRRSRGSRSATGTATRSTTPTASSSRRPAWSFSGTSPDNNLVEFVELPADVHPYYVATQAHPELRSRPTRPHPLFAGLIGAAIQRQRELLIPIDESALRRRWVADDDVTMDERRARRRTPRARQAGDPALDRA